MKPHFLITGLPRSRTAWLANLFSTGPVMCLHEPVVYAQGGVDGVKPLLDSLVADVVGMSDSTIPLFWDVYAAQFLPCPIVVIDRPLEVCVASLSEHTGFPVDRLFPVVRAVQQELAVLQQAAPTLTVPFDELNSLDTLQNIWTYCVPSVEFNVERAAFLQTLNVQQPFNPPPCLGSPQPPQ